VKARERQGQLLWAARRGGASHWIAQRSERESVLELGDLAPDWLDVLLSEVCPASIEALVARQQLRPIAGEVLEEVLARPGPQVQQIRPDRGCFGVPRCPHDVGHEIRSVGEAGQDRSHPNPSLDAGIDEPGQRGQPLPRRCRGRLGSAPDLVIERRDREGHPDVRAGRGLREDVDVAEDHRAAGDDRQRGLELGQGLDAAPGQPVSTLGGLVRIGGGADDDGLTPPSRSGKLAPQDFDDVDLHPDRSAVAIVRSRSARRSNART